MKKINLYSDGSSLGNPGAGGWGTILEYEGKRKELSAGNPLATWIKGHAGHEQNERCDILARSEAEKFQH